VKIGPLVIVSGPSGSGKSTVIQRVLQSSPWPLRLSVSATTRPARSGEQDGVHYYFWSRERFEREVRAGAFLEWAEVYSHRYGTLKSEVEPRRREGKGVILDIDVQGARAVRQQIPEAKLVFLRTSVFETYERRLRERASEDESKIQERLATARKELECAGEYDFQVINDDLNVAVEKFQAILRQLFERK
jgi:guanylate kinase